jgi:hypothetical protein
MQMGSESDGDFYWFLSPLLLGTRASRPQRCHPPLHLLERGRPARNGATPPCIPIQGMV